MFYLKSSKSPPLGPRAESGPISPLFSLLPALGPARPKPPPRPRAPLSGGRPVGPPGQVLPLPPAGRRLKPEPARRLPASNPADSDPIFSNWLRGFVPLGLLFLFPQESKQMVEDSS